MTALTSAGRPGQAASRHAGPGRWALGIVIPGGPLATAVIRGILPYRTLDTPAATAAKIAAHQDTESLATCAGAAERFVRPWFTPAG